MRLESKYKYKRAIKQAIRQDNMEFDDELSNLWLNKDMTKFWNKWNSRFSKRSTTPDHINDCYDDKNIADLFSSHFASAQYNSYADADITVNYLNSLHLALEGSRERLNDANLFDIADIESCLASLKNGKACGFDGLSKESVLYSHPAVIVHLKLLFNMICMHGFVPNNFGVGVITPIIKDKLGNICDVNNYRPITLSPVISKIFEKCILQKFSSYFESDPLQFGFKKGSSCSHVVFVLSQVVDYFTSHDSTVYVASLDASKAFDRVNHVKLFRKLLEKGIPVTIVKVLSDWYGKV